MDKLLSQLEQDRKRSRDEFEKMKQRVDIIDCVGMGFLILTSIACAVIVIVLAVVICD